jgi:phage gpG-like protein
MLEIQWQISGDEELNAAFQAFARAVTDWRPYWPTIAGVFYEAERARFASDGFGTWPRLSDGYAKWKTKNYPGEPMMSLTGNLRRSLTDRFGPNAVYEDEPQSLVLGTTVPYAAAHHYGYPPRNLPARPIIGVRDTDPELMATLALIQFERTAQALGFETKAA